MTNTITRLVVWVLRMLTPLPIGKRAVRADRARRSFEAAEPARISRRSEWRDFVPAAEKPPTDEPPMEDSATVVRPYLMTPAEIAAWRQPRAGGDRQPDERHERHVEALIPSHSWGSVGWAATVIT